MTTQTIRNIQMPANMQAGMTDKVKEVVLNYNYHHDKDEGDFQELQSSDKKEAGEGVHQ